ncbi:MAG: hypothetical protein KME19_03620 [Microcoleus vaginatus WJT46-NPBG5]|nr:hypothetical protein [Microcoleus vaginatus WJT46-NPBG5]
MSTASIRAKRILRFRYATGETMPTPADAPTARKSHLARATWQEKASRVFHPTLRGFGLCECDFTRSTSIDTNARIRPYSL